jgi:hypothetical protein
MMHESPPANDGRKSSARPACVPRPTTPPQTNARSPKASAPVPAQLASKLSLPPPSPKRAVYAKPAKASPPPLPQPALLADADLIDDEDITQVVRNTQPTSVDVEIDCFSCTEPPPESRPRRKLRLLAGVTSLLLLVASGVLLWGRPLASDALQRLDVVGAFASRAPAMLTLAAVSSPTSGLAPQKSPPTAALATHPAATLSVVSSAAPRPKLSAHSKREHPASAKPHKKPSKPAKQLLH